MKNRMIEKRKRIARRHLRVRTRISGTKIRPRISVFKSNKHIYAQLIDDESKKTLLSVSDKEIKRANQGKKARLAEEVGKLLAKKAAEIKIEEAVFDRGGYKFHGRIKQLAEGARKGGLKF